MKTSRLLLFLLTPLWWTTWLFSQNTSPQPTPQRAWADTLLAQQLINESRQLSNDDHNGTALEKAQQAMAIYTDLYGENHLQTAIAAMHVARGIRNFRRDEEAVTILQHSMRVFEAAHDTIQMALCHNLLCSCRRNQSQLAQALQHIQTAIALVRTDSTRNAALLANFKITLAYIYDEEKNYLAAIPLLEEAKAVHALNKNEFALGLTSYHLGEAYFGLHDFVRAKENYLTAWVHLKSKLIPSHSYFTDLLVQIGLCCQKTRASELGLRYLLDARAIYLGLGPEDMRYLGFLQTLGKFYLVEKQYPAAIEQFEACLTAREKVFGPQSYYLYPTLRSLGEAYMYSAQFAQAEACYRRGLQIEINLPGADQKLTGLFYSDLATVKLAQGDFAGSLLLCDTAFSVVGFDP
ncbi:MAG: tetratricopeptide repeat protein, partial [Saprospiraceae bacterium]|nr:tetratricopeptide repeat protein [Saprospiraceae bacterium]